VGTVPSTVRTEGLTVQFRRRLALCSVDLELTSGAIALVGPNGSGKSTLLKVLATILRANSGCAEVDGHSLSSSKGAEAARRCLGYLPQTPTALGNLTVTEACHYVAFLKGVPRRARRAEVDRSINDFDLQEVAHRKLDELSGGTHRRAHIAVTFVHQPAVALLDEPTAGLDPTHAATVREQLVRLAQNRLLLYSTHLAEDIADVAARLVVLNEGKVAFDGSVADFTAASAATQRRTDRDDLMRGLQGLGIA